MSAIALAEAIDRLVAAGQAFVAEAESAITVSHLEAAVTADLRDRTHALGWPIALYDSANNACTDEAPDQAFAPYRLIIQKPAAGAGILRLLTNTGLARWLQQGHAASRWQVARLTGVIVTRVRQLEPWDADARAFSQAASTKSPRSLVREYADVRRVPEDIRPWLAEPLDALFFATPAAQVWVHAAAEALTRTLPDEIDPVDGTLKFRGPPRLVLPALPEIATAPDRSTFDALQKAVAWVFEHEREAEMRHILLATELARSGSSAVDTIAFLQAHMAHAWESAQLAYQMALAETSRDTLKVLSDLRKAVTDETAKLNDMGRQLAASVAGALATGIGLVAARVAAGTPLWLNVTVTVVVALYVAMTIIAGINFIRLQRQLRSEWQPRLYRFLPANDYARMVTDPVAQAERSFFRIAWCGGAAVLAIAVACLMPLPRPAILAVAHPSASPAGMRAAPTNVRVEGGAAVKRSSAARTSIGTTPTASATKQPSSRDKKAQAPTSTPHATKPPGEKQ